MTDQNTENETGAVARDTKAWPFVVVAFCLVALILSWSINYLLITNDGALQVFIETFLPIFQWLLRLPEHFIT